MMLLHRIIFWSHLLAGIIAGLVIFIMSATRVVLMYEHQLVEYAERDVREITPSGAAMQRLSLDDLVANGREQNPGFQLASVVLRKDVTASVAVGFGRNGVSYVNPLQGRSGARARSCTTGFTTWSSGTAGWAGTASGARRAAATSATDQSDGANTRAK